MDTIYFEDIYTKYFKVLYHYSLRIVENEDAAQDIVQDVFTECWVRREQLDISTSLKPYLYTLAYNRSLDFLKSSEKQKKSVEISALDELFYSTFTTDDDLYSENIGKEIAACVDALPERCREVFRLSRHDNLKNREIASRLNISVKAVEKHISKALHEIRSHLVRTGYFLGWLIGMLISPPCFN